MTMYCYKYAYNNSISDTSCINKTFENKANADTCLESFDTAARIDRDVRRSGLSAMVLEEYLSVISGIVVLLFLSSSCCG